MEAYPPPVSLSASVRSATTSSRESKRDLTNGVSSVSVVRYGVTMRSQLVSVAVRTASWAASALPVVITTSHGMSNCSRRWSAVASSVSAVSRAEPVRSVRCWSSGLPPRTTVPPSVSTAVSSTAVSASATALNRTIFPVSCAAASRAPNVATVSAVSPRIGTST